MLGYASTTNPTMLSKSDTREKETRFSVITDTYPSYTTFSADANGFGPYGVYSR